MHSTFPGLYHLSRLKRDVAGLSIIVVLVFSGCTTVAVQPKKIVEHHKTLGILKVLKAKELSIRHLKGLFRASITGALLPLSHSFPGVIFYTRPDSIRLKGLTPVGGTLFQFTQEGKNYRLRIPGSGQLTRGSVRELGQAGDLGQAVDLSLKAMDTVLGKIRGLESDEIRLYEEDRGFRMDFHDSPVANRKNDQVILTRTWIDKQHYNITNVEYLDQDGALLMRIKCEDFRPMPGLVQASGEIVQLPFRLEAEDTRLSGTVTLEFQEMVVNSGV